MKGVAQIADAALSVATKAELLKNSAGLVLNIFAALLAFNVWYNTHLTTKMMDNTIAANDIWSHYQAKSIKGLLCELTAKTTDKAELAKDLAARVARYDAERTELHGTARLLEAGRDDAKRRLPWIGYANTVFQIAIVMLSASILTAKRSLYRGSFAVAAIGVVLMCQGLLLFW